MRKLDRTCPPPSDAALHRNRTLIPVLLGVFGLSLLSGVLLASPSLGGVLSELVDVPIAVLVIGTPLLVLTLVYGWAGVVDACGYCFGHPSPGKKAADAATFFRLWAAFALAAGFLVTLVGLILMLGHLNDPAQLGPGLSAALLGQVYGVFIAAACVVLSAVVTRRHNGQAALAPLASEAAGMGGITVIAGTVTTLIAFGILMLSLSPGL